MFLDNDLNVRRFTEQITRDHPPARGRHRPPLERAGQHLDLSRPARRREGDSADARVYREADRRRPTAAGSPSGIMPYRTLANVIQGVVITFVDVTVAKELEARLRQA
ncbi:MAG: hypothetical protein MZW92_65820 [Comamonadaceae bacterium]|nr:hypothetical protein [Comamonadaceae bacterium]